MTIAYYYQEITCLPDLEIGLGFVMGKVMDAVHLALVNISKGGVICPIGISFPEYRSAASQPEGDHEMPPIGSKIRLFGQSEDDLQRLGISVCLQRFSDYVHLTSVRPVERRIRNYAIYKRFQPKTSKARLVRRQMKRQGISEAEAQHQYATFQPRYTTLPYLNLHSHSTGQHFRLYIEKCDCDSSTGVWAFSTYGLSSATAVPHF
jgi:CRISPR-associated endonuclease Csy4